MCVMYLVQTMKVIKAKHGLNNAHCYNFTENKCLVYKNPHKFYLQIKFLR